MNTCPICGKENSCCEEFCGNCEQQYKEEQYNAEREELTELRRKIDNCDCIKVYGEPCEPCMYRCQKISAIKNNKLEEFLKVEI